MTAGRHTPSTSGIAAACTTLLTLTALAVPLAPAAAQLTTPEEQFGYRIGTDYQLVNYQGLTDYWHLLAEQSDRMTVESIGRTSEGREQWMATITSPANRPDLERYKEIAARLAHADGATEEEARALAAEGKAVVWIDGGLHATEVLGAQQLMELVWQMVSRDDAETMRFLDEVILLVVHANPDGHALVANWYMRNDDPMERSTGRIPVLYNKYAGHDNNRDFYMASLSETENMNRVMYREWFPHIVYNHHQTGPSGTVMFAPPFRDPPNHNLDPIIITSLDQVGSAMHHRMVVEGKGGTTMRRGASYSTWWNGGLRTTPYFHNMIGLLTETIGNPTPIEIPFLPNRQISHGDLPLPVNPGRWHFRQSIDYSQTANRAVLDYAVPQPRAPALQHLAHGDEFDRAGQPGLVDDPAQVDRPGRGGGQRTPLAGGLRPLPARPRQARRPRLHPAGRPARLPHRDPVRERAPQERREGAPGHGRLQRGREGLPRRLLCGHRLAGVPSPRARHVRAAESPERLPVPGRAADRALRQRRVDAGAPDGGRVRPHPRRFQRALRADRVDGRPDARHGHRSRVPRGLHGGPHQRGVHRGQSRAGERRRRLLD